MPILLTWTIAYVIPALTADALVKLLPKQRGTFHIRNAAIMHGALVLSGLGSQYAIYYSGHAFPWGSSLTSIGLYVAAIGCAYTVIGKLGVWYGLSSLVQEFALLSIAFLLLSAYSFFTTLLLIVSIFTFSHLLHAKHWLIRVTVISLWGVTSITLFLLSHNIWVIASLHAVLGALFIKKEILYPSIHFRKKKT